MEQLETLKRLELLADWATQRRNETPAQHADLDRRILQLIGEVKRIYPDNWRQTLIDSGMPELVVAEL